MSETNILAVVLGAGASYDCVEANNALCDTDYRPPLTYDLFSFRRSFNGILHRYPKAEALSDTIRSRLKRGQNLEGILQELEAEQNFLLKKQYWQVPLYLQELFGEIGKHYLRAGGTKFDTLIREVERSKYNRVLYLTLNYDLFIENALRVYGVKFEDLQSYCRDDFKWDLVKLHGSVNWGRKLLTPHPSINHSVNLLDSLTTDLKLDKDIHILKGHQNGDRFTSTGFCYPALAVPLGIRKESVCHPSHIERARTHLRNCTDFLIIGCSALDEDLLDLLGEVGNVRRFMVVNGSLQAANEAIGRLSSANQAFPRDAEYPDRSHSFNGGFSEFVASQLTSFLSQ